MFKIVAIMIMSLMSMSLFTGCVTPDIYSDNKGSSRNVWADQTSADDVDLSDMDEDLRESEMMMTEGDTGNKIQRMEFPASEYYRLARTGKGTVKGTIYVKDAYDRRILGESTRLYLNPVTSYSEQWYEESYLGGYEMEKADSRLFNYLRFTASDKNGNFAFYGVPSGSYYLIGTVKCGEECGYNGTKNIRIATKLTIRGNQVLQQDLTRVLD